MGVGMLGRMVAGMASDLEALTLWRDGGGMPCSRRLSQGGQSQRGRMSASQSTQRPLGCADGARTAGTSAGCLSSQAFPVWGGPRLRSRRGLFGASSVAKATVSPFWNNVVSPGDRSGGRGGGNKLLGGCLRAGGWVVLCCCCPPTSEGAPREHA